MIISTIESRDVELCHFRESEFWERGFRRIEQQHYTGYVTVKLHPKIIAFNSSALVL